MLQFSDEAARKLEAIYSSADVVAQRRAMLDRLSLRPGESVIDIGCGPGFLCGDMAVAVAETGTVVGVDISEDLIAFARARNACSWLTYQHGDARALNVPDASFDVAASAQVLEYLDDPDRAIAEMFRVLKPADAPSLWTPIGIASRGTLLSRTECKRSEKLGKLTAPSRGSRKLSCRGSAQPGSRLPNWVLFRS